MGPRDSLVNSDSGLTPPPLGVRGAQYNRICMRASHDVYGWVMCLISEVPPGNTMEDTVLHTVLTSPADSDECGLCMCFDDAPVGGLCPVYKV